MQLKRITFCIALAFAPGAFAAETLPEVPVRSEALQPLPTASNDGLDQNSLTSNDGTVTQRLQTGQTILGGRHLAAYRFQQIGQEFPEG